MGRAPCCEKNGLKKGPWTQEEDLKLIQHIQVHGPGNWRNLPKNAGLQRCGKSCRLRWTNYLRPDIKRGRFSFEEEETIIQLHSILGNKWSAIAARLPGRTDNEIKNYWNTHIRKRLLRNGIDPVTHSPRLDILDLSSIIHSTQLNLSNLLGLQTLVNPELLRLVSTLLASQHENPEMLSQKLQVNQLLNTELQNQTPMLQTTNLPSSSVLNQTQMQGMDMGQISINSTDSSCENFLENVMPSSLNIGSFGSLPTCGYNLAADPSDDSAFQLLNNTTAGRNGTFDSVISIPMSSSTPINSPSTFINSSSATEDERESYCSNMFKFEIPESLDFDDFM
ncbi:hypothetical protein RHSIM_Rhsim06G0153300 [Rhododendron simsii]|uniref:Uncharacterized protein n=1 Tax=Rhododendron simsii TaxID=118357 RepID=A0A834GWW2_RHOSS|nr:hypothetical protein RHSIM_Rhsim06G0153300 [Rhododendron simsii]